MKLDQQIIDLIQSDDLDCIKLGLTYLKQDLDKCDISDKKANYLRNFYYHVMARFSKIEELKKYKPYRYIKILYFRNSELIEYIHTELRSTIF